MRFAAIIDARAGTVAGTSPAATARRLAGLWASLGAEAEVIVAEGKEFGRAVRHAAGNPA